MKLMIARQFFDDAAAAVILEYDEMPDQGKKPALVKHAPQQDFKLWHRGGRDGFAINRAPRHEPFLIGADGANACLQAVGNYHHRVVDEKRRDLLFVCLELLERLPDVGIFVRCILQFDDTQQQAIDENYHVRAAVVLALYYGELVHHQPVVIVCVGKINQSDNFCADAAILPTGFDSDAVHQHSMKCTIVGDERRMLRKRDFTEGVLQRFCREFWI